MNQRSRRLTAVVPTMLVLTLLIASCGSGEAGSAPTATGGSAAPGRAPASPGTSAVEPTTTSALAPVATTAPTAPAAAVADVPITTAAPAATEATTTTVARAATVERSGADVSPDVAVGEPLSISIPAIGVSSPLVGAGVLPDGTVAVPPDADIAGWFTGGPRPGERGPAVIMGHVDSKRTGPGVFWKLVELPVGSVVIVETTTTPQRFVVQSVQQFPKDQFPTDAVYGSVPSPALRLITCGGSFDRSIGHYRDNIVAFLVPEVGT